MAKPIPDKYHTLTPNLTFKDTKKAIEFYENAFGAKVIDIFPELQGDGVMHAAMQIGDSMLMLGDEREGGECKSAETMGGSPVSLCIYVENVDAMYERAMSAGCTSTMPVMEMFWGDRAGNVKDPFGYMWMIATHTRDMSMEEMRREAEAFFAQMAR